MKPILDIAKKWNIKNVSLRGNHIAKVQCDDVFSSKKNGKLVLVTAITSNKSGVGKTTVSIGLADAMNSLGKKAMLALREPSMGPVFGIKGGATGGGKSQVVPGNEINLHFTGDFHAIAQANNLLVSILDNHIFQGNSLGIDLNNIFVKRCLDLNERSLRDISYQINGQEVHSGFVITAASEIMAILALSKDITELKEKLGNILVALNTKGKPVFAKDLHAEDAMTILLRQAFYPNLVQTLCGNPALVHLGPFANIAHGCNSIVATRYALAHADFCVTEAGFGTDLGAEKFFDIKCRTLQKVPDAVVLVVTLDVVKEHGNGDVVKGFENVRKHIQNCREVFSLPTVVAINKHKTDDKKELDLLCQLCQQENVETTICTAYDDGAKGCVQLAKLVEKYACAKNTAKAQFVYQLDEKIESKIEKIATKVYGAKKVELSDKAKEKIKLANKLGFSNFFVNIAKTQFSFTDNKDLLGAPKDFVFHITDVEIRSGAKMIVAIAGGQILMPGLGKNSNYLKMKIDPNGKIEGVI